MVNFATETMVNFDRNLHYAYDYTKNQPNYMLSAEYTKGIRKDKTKAPWEIDAKASYLLANDTTSKKSNLNNEMLTGSMGLNFVLKQNKKDQSSTMELKVFAQDGHQFKNVINNLRDSVTINATYKIKVFNSFWVPLTLCYDVNSKDHPLFGFLSISLSLDKGTSKNKSSK